MNEIKHESKEKEYREIADEKEMAQFRNLEEYEQKIADRRNNLFNAEGLNYYYQLAATVSDPQIKMDIIHKALIYDKESAENIESSMNYWRMELGL